MTTLRILVAWLFLIVGLTAWWELPEHTVWASSVATGTLAFIAGPSVTNPTASTNIYVSDVATGEPTAVTTNQTDALYGSLSWSPDGKYLAFSLWADRQKAYGNFGNFHIYTLDLATKITQQLTDGESDLLPTWSPDGTRIAFISLRNNHYGIYLMNADGSNSKVLTTANLSGFYWWLSWSPDGHTIAFILDNDATCPHIFTMHNDGTNIHQVTQTPACEGTSLSWSPDSRQIVFTRQDGQIYVLTLSTGQVRQLTQSKTGFYHSPAWSPDGSVIAFASFDDIDTIASPQEAISLMNANGAGIRQQIHLPDMTVSSLTWRPGQ